MGPERTGQVEFDRHRLTECVVPEQPEEHCAASKLVHDFRSMGKVQDGKGWQRLDPEWV